jgi:hypothetical protein
MRSVGIVSDAVWGSLPTSPVPVGTVSDMNAKLWETFSDGCNCLGNLPDWNT